MRPSLVAHAMCGVTRQFFACNKGLSSDGGSRTFGLPKVDERHQLWRFDGEYWRDEFARYRQVVTSKCQTDQVRHVDVAPRPPPRY